MHRQTDDMQSQDCAFHYSASRSKMVWAISTKLDRRILCWRHSARRKWHWSPKLRFFWGSPPKPYVLLLHQNSRTIATSLGCQLAAERLHSPKYAVWDVPQSQTPQPREITVLAVYGPETPPCAEIRNFFLWCSLRMRTPICIYPRFHPNQFRFRGVRPITERPIRDPHPK